MPDVAHAPASQELRQHTPRRDIQGLRAIAVIVVVAFHAGLPVPGGFVGVDIFFVISGFVITGMLMRELTASSSINLRRFYGRRVKRLLPALTLVLVVTLILTFLLGSPFDNQQETTAATAIGAILMFANAVIFLRSGDYFATPPTNNPLLNTWSLSVEEQFYLVFPAILLLLWWWSRRRLGHNALIVTGIAVGVGLSFMLCLAMTFGIVSGPLTDPGWFAFYSSPTRAWEFGVGALAWFVAQRLKNQWFRSANASLWWLGMAGIVLSVFMISEASLFPGWVVLLPVLSTALVLVAGEEKPWGVAVLTNRPMVAVGDASYSWYLWHWPLIAFSVMLLPSLSWAPLAAAVLSLLLAAVTLRFLENPIRFSPLRGRSIIALGLGCVALVVTLSLGLILGARTGWSDPGIRGMKAQVSEQHRWLDECNSASPLGLRGPECRWNSEAQGEPIYLVGDSMAGALGEGLTGAGETLGRPIVVGTKGACPFVDARLHVDGRLDNGCQENVSGSLDWLERQEPSDVVLSSTLGYIVIDGVGLVRSGESEPVYDPAAKEQVYLEGLSRAVERLTSAGHRVTVVLPPPGFPTTVMAYEAWRPSQCTTWEALTDIASCGVERAEAEVVSETAALFSRVRDAVTSAGGVVWDPREAVCEAGVCATNVGDQWRYLDGSHLSVAMSEALAPDLASLVTSQE